MQESRVMMGMPIVVDIADVAASQEAIDKVFAYFTWVEEKFSVYKPTSEISRINSGQCPVEEYSAEMIDILARAEKTRQETHGYFDIETSRGMIDPSGIVKGWAIFQAAELLKRDGFRNFFVDAGGDIQAEGVNSRGDAWRVGIRNPLSNNPSEACIKVMALSGCGVATSGSYIRGNHIYNPKQREIPIKDIVSLTVIGENVYEADRFATAAFAMGREGIHFIESRPGLEGYMVDSHGIATSTSGFARYCVTV